MIENCSNLRRKLTYRCAFCSFDEIIIKRKFLYWLICSLLFMTLSAPAQTSHFEKCWSGGAYNSMSIYVVLAQINDLHLQANDEIAVFDGDVCVGHKRINEQVPSFQSPLLIETSQADGDSCGFSDGNPIFIKVWDAGEAIELDAALQFYDSDTAVPIQPIPFQANGSAVVGFNIKYPPEIPQIEVFPTSYNYGHIRVGTKAPGIFIVTNTGTAQLDIEEPTLSGSDAQQFILSTGSDSLLLQAGDSHTMIVECAPTSKGVKNAELTLWSNDPDNPHLNVPLSGQGVEPDIDVFPPTVDFGRIAIDSSTSSLLLIHNVGDAPLSLTSISLVDDAQNQYSIINGGNPAVIGPDSSQMVEIIFSPTAAGVHSAELWICSDDPDESVVKIALNGTGLLNTFYLVICAHPDYAGTTSPAPGTYSRTAGDTISISAQSNSGYQFVGWTGDVGEQATEETIQVIMDANKSVTAHFTAAEETCHLTIQVNPAGAGTTIPAEGIHDYAKDSRVPISAMAAPLYQFVSWSGDVDDSAKPETFIRLNENKTVVANFALIPVEQFTLTLIVDPSQGGVTVPPPGSYYYNKGSVVNLFAAAKSGFKFSGWTGDVSNPATQNTTVTMTSNKTIIAHFAVSFYRVTLRVQPAGAGWTKPSVGDTIVTAADSIFLRADAAQDYKFVQWYGSVNSASNPLIICVEHHLDITAQFEKEEIIVQQPVLQTMSTAFCQQTIDFYIKDANVRTGLPVEYQFDWGDSSVSDWLDLSEQKSYNITKITTASGQSDLPNNGYLVDYQTGQRHAIELSVSGGIYQENPDAWNGAEPLPGTDAFFLFDGYVNCKGTLRSANTAADSIRLTFSHLSSNKKYLVALYSNADSCGWNQASIVSLSGAESFINSSSTGTDETGQALFNGPQSPHTRLPADNTESGYIARFNDINPGNDGIVDIVISHSDKNANKIRNIYANAVMLQEFDLGGSVPVFTAYNDLGWSGDFISYKFAAAGTYPVLARARFKKYPEVFSSWSDAHQITVEGCRITPYVTGGADATISKIPDKEFYDYGESVTLNVTTHPGWVFSHWEADPADSTTSRIIYVNHHYNVYAYFKRISNSAVDNFITSASYRLEQNYPNPFNPSTEIYYKLTHPEFVRLKIFNIRGALVKTLVEAQQSAGEYRVRWNAFDETGRKVPSGVYFYQFEAGLLRKTRRMLLLQ